MRGPILVIGRSGQLTRALAHVGTISARQVVAVGRPQADLTEPQSLAATLARHGPAALVNTAAFTAVDDAEVEPAQAFAVNAAGAGNLARACAQADVPLIHLSTDYVFDGLARRPYREDDMIAPVSVYGASKAEGEVEIRAAGGRHVILRTSWLYSESGQNFLTNMLRLGGERPELGIVDDQEASPTYAVDIARAIARIVETILDGARVHGDIWGTYHFVNAGSTTRYGFAKEIFARAEALGWQVPRLKPITTAEYPTPARRPPYSVLDSSKIMRVFGVDRPDWREALGRCFACVARSEKART